MKRFTQEMDQHFESSHRKVQGLGGQARFYWAAVTFPTFSLHSASSGEKGGGRANKEF